MRNKYILSNYIFIISLIILILNDQFLKFQFSNWVTGKLSDFFGITILPLLLVFLFPKLKQNSIWISAILFIFWKSPISQPFIDFYNKFSPIQTSRIIDYTDLIALIFLLVPYWLINNIASFQKIQIQKIHEVFILIPTALALMSTSPPPSYYYTYSQGNLRCHKCSMTIKKSEVEIRNILRKNNIKIDTLINSKQRKISNLTYYRIEEFVIENDTLKEIDFSMLRKNDNKTKIYFNGLKTDQNIDSIELNKKLIKFYKKAIFKEFKNVLK